MEYVSSYYFYLDFCLLFCFCAVCSYLFVLLLWYCCTSVYLYSIFCLWTMILLIYSTIRKSQWILLIYCHQEIVQCFFSLNNFYFGCWNLDDSIAGENSSINWANWTRPLYKTHNFFFGLATFFHHLSFVSKSCKRPKNALSVWWMKSHSEAVRVWLVMYEINLDEIGWLVERQTFVGVSFLFLFSPFLSSSILRRTSSAWCTFF